jgi:hypothetical protein
MQTDFVMYLDFAEAFHKMLDDGLIRTEGEAEGDMLYGITEKGRTVAESLHSDILSSILDKSLSAALRYLVRHRLDHTLYILGLIPSIYLHEVPRRARLCEASLQGAV